MVPTVHSNYDYLNAHHPASSGYETDQRKRSVGGKVPRKDNFISKIRRDDKATKISSFLKRQPTLFKKANELQKLCGVSVSIVIYSHDGTLYTWPENGEQLRSSITMFKGIEPKNKRKLTLMDTLVEKKRRLEKKKRKVVANKFHELTKWLEGLSEDALKESIGYLEQKLMDFKEKLDNNSDGTNVVSGHILENQKVEGNDININLQDAWDAIRRDAIGTSDLYWCESAFSQFD
ncbi:hypothetical protein K2173_011367 [Erythroxylum novogranatense]|uniref:MADS-box domain-containing protein n=1 Tax=Erythroxylum novogranatense TaxID=1862640 RepID=A0AAV8S9I5_9ROSI|nr:hypothetical protein K2173_011367 [Erythroxylum novogranatense]